MDRRSSKKEQRETRRAELEKMDRAALGKIPPYTENMITAIKPPKSEIIETILNREFGPKK